MCDMCVDDACCVVSRLGPDKAVAMRKRYPVVFDLEAYSMSSCWHSQVAGIKAAGAKVWGPLMNVVTPHKLFLFVLFQVRLLTQHANK